MAEAKAFKMRSLNLQDLFDEFVVSIVLYWKFLYTGAVGDLTVE